MKKIIFIALICTLSVGALKAQNRLSAETSAHWIKLFPNPATSFINVDVSRLPGSYAYLQVYNFMGRKVYETRINNNRSTLYLNDYFRGVYIYQLRDKNGAVLETGKFQVLK